MRIRPGEPGDRQPALDGLRALAVAMVMAYHGGVDGFSTAGFYGVDIFFVLSGYLITSLLLDEQAAQGHIRFGRFWARRARRLLPGLLVMLTVVDLYVALLAPAGRYPSFRGDALSVVAYISNWHFIAASSNYFVASGFPSLLTHTWSLAIEEQFYVIWPLVVWAAIAVARRRGRAPASFVLAAGAIGACASTAWMAWLHRGGADLSRLYYGTDTHAQSILVGTVLAAVAALRPNAMSRIPWPAAAAAGGGLLWATLTMGSSDPRTYQGGFLVVAVLSAVLVGHAAGRTKGALARLLSAPPLPYLGRISYGMYLWYFPLFAVLDRARTGLGGATLLAVRCAADVAVAAASFHLVEMPVRRWGAGPRPALVRWAPLGAGAAAVAAVASLVLADTTPAFSVSRLDSASGPPAAAAGPATAAGPAGQLTVMVVGDSTGATLGLDLAQPAVEQAFGIRIDDRAFYGCGVALSTEVLEHGQPTPTAAPCNSASPPDQQWPALLRDRLQQVHPDVVLLAAGRWEVQSRRTGSGPWTNLSQPSDAAYIGRQLEAAASIVADAHTTFAVATAPCFSSGEQADGGAWPEDGPARLQVYNHLVRSMAAAHQGQIRLLDLDALLCPGGRFHGTLDGVTVRAPDGVHYPVFSITAPASPAPDTLSQCVAFGEWMAPRLLAAVRPTG